MYSIELPKVINQIISFFHRLKIWHCGDEPTIKETRIKWFYFFYYLLFPISLITGAIASENKDDSIFLVEVAILTSVLSIKLLCLIWKKDQILEILNRICVYSIEDYDEFTMINNKLKKFLKCVNVLLLFFVIAAISCSVVAPFLGSEKKLFFNIGFPLDYKNNEVAYWIAATFIFTQVILSTTASLFSIIIWYTMFNCALRYEILGNQIRNIGVVSEVIEVTGNKRKLSDLEKENIFLRDLLSVIDTHQHVREIINQLASFYSNLFFFQIVTSGLCICGSTYCLAFDVGENLLERMLHLATLFYNISEIFMIMYFGNEIKFSSDRLPYCLFESNWIDQPQSTKKLIIVFGELLQKPHELVIGTLYPLTLETFRRIINFAYNTFNILKNLH